MSVVTVKRRGYIFSWEGGQYIEIARAEKPDHPFDVINVSNAPVVAVSPLGLGSLIDRWQDGFVNAFRFLDEASDSELGESERTKRRKIAADLAAASHHAALARDALDRVHRRLVDLDEAPRASMATAFRKVTDAYDLINAAILLRRGRNG